MTPVPIPEFPDSRPLDLSDREYVEQARERLQPRISEMTFSGLYLFRRAHHYRLCRVGNAAVILGRGWDGSRYFLPPLDGDRETALRRLMDERLCLYGADSTLVPLLRLLGADVVEDRDNADYLYLREDLATLQGNRYHNKKNRINYFVKRHDHRVEMFRPDHAGGALDLLGEWAAAHNCSGGATDGEVAAAGEAIRLMHHLHLQGVVVLVEGRVRAFTLGEWLNRDTSVAHFQKADPFAEGLYQLVDREFNRLLFTDCLYVNREQDLGVPGLRASKLSYHPVELVMKYRARMP